MKKAIFLDRDGVINFDPGHYTWNREDFRFLPGAIEFCQWAASEGFLLIIITNQAGIERGIYTHQDVVVLMAWLVDFLAKKGVPITDYYYSPHYDAIGRSLDRKPGSLMVEKAIAKYEISKEYSYFIGDREKDMLAASGAGVKGIKVETNEGLAHLINNLAT